MRIRYAYKLENNKGEVKFYVHNWVNREDEVLEKFKGEGYTKCTFHDRVRTGFRMLEDGTIEPTGLVKTPEVEQPAPTPKTKKAKATA
jgi:hypothetical protein